MNFLDLHIIFWSWFIDFSVSVFVMWTYFLKYQLKIKSKNQVVELYTMELRLITKPFAQWCINCMNLGFFFPGMPVQIYLFQYQTVTLTSVHLQGKKEKEICWALALKIQTLSARKQRYFSKCFSNGQILYLFNTDPSWFINFDVVSTKLGLCSVELIFLLLVC